MCVRRVAGDQMTHHREGGGDRAQCNNGNGLDALLHAAASDDDDDDVARLAALSATAAAAAAWSPLVVVVLFLRERGRRSHAISQQIGTTQGARPGEGER